MHFGVTWGHFGRIWGSFGSTLGPLGGKFGAFWVPRGSDHYIAGWYKRNNTHLFVSRGLGWSVAPIRVGAPPEIAWIDIITDGTVSE